MRFVNWKYGFILMALCYGSPTCGQVLNPEQKARIDKVFEHYSTNPGCALGVFKKGRMLMAKGYGLSNLESKTRIDQNTVFNIASVSKQFTAACIFLLEMEGKLSLEDDVKKFLPDLPRYGQDSIKVKHLVYHTSGLRSYLKLLHVKGIPWGNSLDNAEVVQMLAKQRESNFKAGSAFSYSNSGYALLANIVEKASGISFASFVQQNIFEPLDMHHSFINDKDALTPSDVALSYSSHGDGYQIEAFENNRVVGDGGVYTTIADFYKWSENFKTAKVGGPGFIAKMMTLGKLNDGRVTDYAGGLFLGDYQNIPGLFTIGHSGEWAGYRSLFFKFVAQDVAIVLLSNNANTNVWGLLNQLVPIVLGKEWRMAQTTRTATEEVVAIPESHANVTTSDRSRYIGHYFNPREGYTRRISLENDKLKYVRATGSETTLTPQGEHRFIFQNAPQVQLEFQTEENPEKLRLTIGNNAPIILEKYVPMHYDTNGLRRFEGNFYSEELDIYYTLKSDASQILIYLKDQELVRLDPVMENIFNAIHFGYLKFYRDPKNEVVGFTINDELIRNIYFKKS